MNDKEAIPGFGSIEEIQERFAAEGYIADRMLATTIFLSVSLGKPVFLEGEPGVGKTEIAKVMARVLDAELIRAVASRDKGTDRPRPGRHDVSGGERPG